VSNGDLLGIGAFALASGLSIHALRHYDEVGLLRPAFVDPVTGFRRYRPEQLQRARLICAVRRVDLPIDAVREVLEDSDGEVVRTVLRRHREQLVDRAVVLSSLVRVVDDYIEKGVATYELKAPRIVQVRIWVTDLAAAVGFYAAAFDATFNSEAWAFEFGTWPGDEYFLLSVVLQADQNGDHATMGPSWFGLLVADVDEAHRRAVKAGAIEVSPPMDQVIKPRSSCVADPDGNRIDLYQG
jgi:DNA-binding transcriptional MerR regulator/predicted enzyme related to lactoylglutathione lyase